MKKRTSAALLFCLIVLLASAQKPEKLSADKQQIIQSVDQRSAELTGLSDSIWHYAETSLLEYRSSKLLMDYAEKQGFKVQQGVSGMPTAFIASYGEGKPIIGILGEYDALPGMSQKTTATEEPLVENGGGHACGHNMFSPAALGAAIAMKELLAAGKIKGTIRFYGTPAEEAYGGKVYMARDGLFNDLDACLDWHPDYVAKANVDGSLSVIDFYVTFKGVSAHASGNPWDGKSALDAAELFTHGVNLLREHVKPTTRMHYVIADGGDAPNIVPSHAKIWMFIRDTKQASVELLYEKMKKIAEGAALMTGTTAEVKLSNGDYEMLVNMTGATVLDKNLKLLGPITYTPEETAFGKKIQEAFGLEQTGINGIPQPLKVIENNPELGSTDVADVSWCVPEISLSATTAPHNLPWHSWGVVACGGMSIGHKGMLYASKAMALTMYDLYRQPETLVAMRKEFNEKKGDRVFKAMLPDGPPPVPGNTH